MKNIFEALDVIKVKPEIYLGEKSLTFLYHYINGYLHRSADFDDEVSEKIRELHFWLPSQTGVENENWLQNLLVKANYSEEQALKYFFYYIEIFRKEIA